MTTPQSPVNHVISWRTGPIDEHEPVSANWQATIAGPHSTAQQAKTRARAASVNSSQHDAVPLALRSLMSPSLE